MKTKNLSLETYQLGDIPDWVTGFSNNMDLIDNFAGNVNEKIENVETSNTNIDQQVQALTSEVDSFGTELSALQESSADLTETVNQNTTLINQLNKTVIKSNVNISNVVINAIKLGSIAVLQVAVPTGQSPNLIIDLNNENFSEFIPKISVCGSCNVANDSSIFYNDGRMVIQNGLNAYHTFTYITKS